MWATLPQMGVVQEILGKVMWKNNPQGAAFTRPACGVLPIAHQHAASPPSPWAALECVCTPASRPTSSSSLYPQTISPSCNRASNP